MDYQRSFQELNIDIRQANDYDEWSELGAVGWSYKDILPYFKKSERYHESDDLDENYHGKEGPMGVRKLPKYSCKMSSVIEDSLNDSGDLVSHTKKIKE